MMLTYGDDRGYAGNTGYADDPTRVYRYDSLVQNHKRIRQGDLAFVRDRSGLLGVARIERLVSAAGVKERQACPVCGTKNLDERRTANIPFRCRQGHVFASPDVTWEPCTTFEALFDTGFISAHHALSLDELRAACPRYGRQLAMQYLEIDRIANRLLERAPATAPLLVSALELFVADQGNESEELPKPPSVPTARDSFEPTGQDTREAVLRAIRVRRGQEAFRRNLLVV